MIWSGWICELNRRGRISPIWAYVVDLDRGPTVITSSDSGSRCNARDLPKMRYLSPRKIPKVSKHRSGQAVMRFVGYGQQGLPRDVYLGVHGSEEVEERYEDEVRDWIEWSLEGGSAPAGWKPAETGHEGVLTVGELVEGYRRHLAEIWGAGWQQVRIDEDQAWEYGDALQAGWAQMRSGRVRGGSVWDKDEFQKGKQRVKEARRRYGHLNEGLQKQWAMEVLGDLLREFGPLAAAVLGDKVLRPLRMTWVERGRSLVDRKLGMEVITDAYCYVIGRTPTAPWNLERGVLEQHADEFGVDRGIVRADGRWVRTG
jgi:hypothetical protein